MDVRGSILGELGWLLFFIATLVVAVYAFNIFLVPHHFSPIVANVLAAIVAALVYIAARRYAGRR